MTAAEVRSLRWGRLAVWAGALGALVGCVVLLRLHTAAAWLLAGRDSDTLRSLGESWRTWCRRPGLHIPRGVATRGPGGVWYDHECLKRKIRSYAGRHDAFLTAYEGPLFDIDLREIGPDSVIQDVGCGTGALAVRLLLERRQFARFHATDIDPRPLDILRTILEDRSWPGADRIVVQEVEAGRPGLPPRSVDVAYILHVGAVCAPPGSSHGGPPGWHLSLILRALVPGLKDGARVVFSQPDIPACTQTDARRTFAEHGFSLVRLGRRVVPEHVYALTRRRN